MQKDFYNKLCVKSITGSISETEEKILAKWLNDSKASKKEFEQLKNAWDRISYDEENSVPEVDLQWSRLNYRIANNIYTSSSQTKWYESLPELFKSFFKPAFAVIVLILLIAVYLLQFNNEPVPSISVSTNSGEKKAITLSDGSSVMLNSSSDIDYPKEFSNTREVQLNGEAFFSVNKSKAAFNVRTKNALVTVLGTKFLIKTNDTKTDVIVKEGKVSFKELNSNRSGVIVASGQRSFVVKNLPPSEPENINTNLALSWMKSVVMFNQTPFCDIKSELESTYGIILLVQKAEINKLTLTGSFEVNTPIDSVLEMICLALDLKYERQHDKYIINQKY